MEKDQMSRHVQSTGQEPVTKVTALHVLMAFDRDDDGNLLPAFEAMQMPSEHSAVLRAKMIAREHAGVIAWTRPANPDLGIYGDAKVLYQAGEVPEMEYGGE